MRFIAKAFFLLFLLLLFFNASALVVNLNKDVFFKGERLILTGNALKNLQVVAVHENGNLVFSEKVPLDRNGDFHFEYDLSFLTPKGKWAISIKDSNYTASKQIIVQPVRESEFFVISFLSPAPSSFRRLDKFRLDVKIQDAGRPVNGAWVNYWDVSGKSHQLKSIGDGGYSTLVEIPIDANLGERSLTVTAYKPSAQGKVGGENSVKLSILSATIRLEVLEPRVNEFIVGKPLAIKLRASYDSGEPVTSILWARAMLGKSESDLNSIGDGFFYFETDPLAGKPEARPMEITLSVKDSFGNTASKNITFRPIGELFWFIRNNALFYIVPALFILYIGFLSMRELAVYLAIIRLKRRQKMLTELKKRLQQDYFIENLISRQDFEVHEQNYDSELNDIGAKLKTLEQKKELL